MDVFFLIVGDGTEFAKIEAYVNEDKPSNVKLMKRLPKEDYDKMVGACDVGMIFLDHRFTIPNFPSRLLSYMQAKIPVLACTDVNTDIGKIAVLPSPKPSSIASRTAEITIRPSDESSVP